MTLLKESTYSRDVSSLLGTAAYVKKHMNGRLGQERGAIGTFPPELSIMRM